jgi:hypothetical protein
MLSFLDSQARALTGRLLPRPPPGGEANVYETTHGARGVVSPASSRQAHPGYLAVRL